MKNKLVGLKFAFGLVFCFLLSALTTTALAQPSDFSKQIKRLAIANLTGESLEVGRLGVTVFGNDRAIVNFTDSSLSDAIFASIVDEIKKEDRYDIRRITLDLGSITKTRVALYDALNIWNARSFSSKPAELQELLKDCECDALLVIAGSGGSIHPNSNQSFRHTALVGQSDLGGKIAWARVYVWLTYMLIDPTTGQIVTMSNNRETANASPLDPKLWPDPIGNLDSELTKGIIQRAAGAAGRSAQLPLFKLGLRPSCVKRYEVLNRSSHADPSLGISPFKEVVFEAGAAPEKCQ